MVSIGKLEKKIIHSKMKDYMMETYIQYEIRLNLIFLKVELKRLRTSINLLAWSLKNQATFDIKRFIL
jgi:hypothetical protein